MRSLAQVALIFFVVLKSVSTVWACPFCDSPSGQQVQAGIFNDQFWGNVLLTLLPLPVLLAIVAMIYFDFPWRPTSSPVGPRAVGTSITNSQGD